MLESKRRAIIFISISFILALTAGFLVLQKVKEMNAQLGEMVEIYVAATDISSRSMITPDQVKAKEIPKKFIDDSYVTDKMSLMNMVTVVPLSAGDVITKNIIKPSTTVRDQNDRLVTVFASGNVIFDQQLEALDRVDIIISREVNDAPVTEVFMKDVPVAMVAKSGDEFKGVALELPFDKVPGFIHQQHYASVMRILKANVGKGELSIPAPFKEEGPIEKSVEKPTTDKSGKPTTPQPKVPTNHPLNEPTAKPSTQPAGQGAQQPQQQSTSGGQS